MDPASLIRTARLRAGLSKRELARRAGTSPAAVVAYETAARSPSLPTLRRILRAAGFDAELALVAVAPTRPEPVPERERIGGAFRSAWPERPGAAGAQSGKQLTRCAYARSVIAGQRLEAVLELASHLPRRRPDRRSAFPGLP